MKERPIIFNGPMIRAILEGRKTQTRRPIKYFEKFQGLMLSGEEEEWCPHGRVGHHLWVKETWRLDDFDPEYHILKPESAIIYKADFPNHPTELVKWRPSVHMPRWASRITLEITGVRVERLQEISKEDAKAEGCTGMKIMGGPNTVLYREHFELLWNAIYAKKGFGWDLNPWVWVISFKRLNCKQTAVGV